MSITIVLPIGYKPVLKNKEKAVIVDIDDTLLQDRKYPMARTIDYVNNLSKDHYIAIVTGREASDRSRTEQQLRDAGVKFNSINFRDQGKDRTEYKRATAERLMSNKNVVLAIENNPDALDAYRSLGLKTKHPNSLPKEVSKHGDHDQSSHGSWATNNFDEETQGEEAQNTYFEKYGIKTDGSKDPVGISREEIRSLNTYTADGYAEINGYLRRFNRDPDENDSIDAKQYRQMQEYRVGDLDKLIEEAPEFFGDKNLYRVFDKSITDTLEVGDFLMDKGFMSTTRVDITREEGLDVLQNLQMIRTTDDTPSIILPSESKRGKGLAVDYVKNAVSDLFENVSTAANEKEVLLPRNTTLKFMGYNTVSISGNPMKVGVFQRMDK